MRSRTAWQQFSQDGFKRGDVIVIRYEGPKGGPGMREMTGSAFRDHWRRTRGLGRL